MACASEAQNMRKTLKKKKLCMGSLNICRPERLRLQCILKICLQQKLWRVKLTINRKFPIYFARFILWYLWNPGCHTISEFFPSSIMYSLALSWKFHPNFWLFSIFVTHVRRVSIINLTHLKKISRMKLGFLSKSYECFSIFDEHVKPIRVNVRQEISCCRSSFLGCLAKKVSASHYSLDITAKQIEKWTMRIIGRRNNLPGKSYHLQKPQISHCFNLYLPFGTFMVNDLLYRPEKQV